MEKVQQEHKRTEGNNNRRTLTHWIYLESIVGDLAIVRDEILNVTNSVSTNVTNTIPANIKGTFQ